MALFGSAGPVMAQLGGDESALPAEAANAKMTLLPAVDHARYKVHEMVDGTGQIRLRQFADPKGKIFAIAWDGRFKPDLSQAMGLYFDEYKKALADGGRVRSRHDVASSDLVVRQFGHMRHFMGVAYLPARIPADVGMDEIK
jgi:hypothetical protein